MCPLPDEAVPRGIEVSTSHWMRQLESVLSPSSPVDILTLYHNGNFFCDREVPVERRAALYDYVRQTQVSTLVVESLPQFVTQDRLAHAARHLRFDQRMEVAIGLQSFDAFLRETVLASPCSASAMDQALTALARHGWRAQVFLMFQMPFLTPQEAAWALERSILQTQARWGIAEPTVCPLRIAPATVAHELHAQGPLQLGSLWNLVDVLHRVRLQRPDNRARVAMSLLQPTSTLEPTTDACPACRQELLQWLDAYNHGALPPLPPQYDGCTCRGSRLPALAYDPAQVRERIDAYLQAVQGASAKN